MILLFDIGNTHTHLGLADSRRVLKQADIPTGELFGQMAARHVRRFVGRAKITDAALCSVVPKATPRAHHLIRRLFGLGCFELTSATVTSIGIDYPRPRTVGADRLANAIAVNHRFGAPSVVVSFGTALAFDVVNRAGNYAGGIIAPGLAAMTDYLHEKTALLPRIKIRDVRRVVGKSTEEAMLIGAVHGYRGLVRELIHELKRELSCRHLSVVATGGCAKLISAGLPEITAVMPELTLEGLRLAWLARRKTG
jgi:type III pantothenate kinase